MYVTLQEWIGTSKNPVQRPEWVDHLLEVAGTYTNQEHSVALQEQIGTFSNPKRLNHLLEIARTDTGEQWNRNQVDRNIM